MQYQNWKKTLKNAESVPQKLLESLGTPYRPVHADRANHDFPMRVPVSYARKIAAGDPNDPLLKQVFPSGEEDAICEGYVDDPLDETRYQISPGVLHKYYGRVLLILTGACAIHCRYCFRRHFPYVDANVFGDKLDQAIAYLNQATDVSEVILSGGDPLSVADDQLAEVIERLELIPHLKRLRIHTRFPIAIPERITAGLIDCFTTTRLRTVVVLHVNHANELDPATRQAISALRNARLALFNQSVLLRGVNDSAATLAALSEALFACGIQPYYLHLLDPVAGASHFEVNERDAKRLMRELQKQLPGYLLPALVKEEPGKAHKTVIEFGSAED